MKKILILILVVIFVFSGCSVPTESGNASQAVVSQSLTPQKEISSAGSVPIQYFGQTNGTLGAGCGTDAGYYYWSESGNNYATLRYIDYASQMVTPLCSRPECSHDNNTCTSWLGWRGGYPQLTSSGSKLVLVYSNTNASYYEQHKDDALAHIQTMSLSGAEKQNIVTLNPNEDIQLGVACDDSFVYIVKATQSDTSAIQMSLCSVSLKDGAIKELCALPKGTSFIMGAADRCLIVKTFSEPQGDTLYSDKDFQIFSCINVDTAKCLKKVELPFRTDAAAVQTLVEGDILYTFFPTDNVVRAESLRTGEIKYEADNIIEKDIQYGQLMRVFGSKLIVSETYAATAEQRAHTFWVDLETGTHGNITLRGNYGTSARGEFSIVPSVQVGERMLTVYQCTSQNIVLSDAYGNSVEAVSVLPQYAFIPVQDYWENHSNFTPIKEGDF